MSSQRICAECGFVHTLTPAINKCVNCKAFLSRIYCYTCEEWKPLSDYMLVSYHTPSGKSKRIYKPCKACEKIRKARYYTPESNAMRQQRTRNRKRSLANDLKATYLNNPNLVYKPLSEKEWLEICAYFGGCALCGKEHIEIRQFVHQFQNGGQYAPWNIIPLCNICAKIRRTGDNPFQYLDKQLGSNVALGHGGTLERRTKILKYIMRRMDEAIERNRIAKAKPLGDWPPSST